MLKYAQFDEKEEKAALEAAAWLGHPNSQKAFADYLITNKQPKQAFVWLETAALQGHVQAQYELAKLYHVGQTYCEKDLTKAFKLYFYAAMQGEVNAQKEVAVISGLSWKEVSQQVMKADSVLKLIAPSKKKEAQRLKEEIIELLFQEKKFYRDNSSRINNIFLKILDLADHSKNIGPQNLNSSALENSEQYVSAQDAFNRGRKFYDLENFHASTAFFLQAANMGHEIAYIYLWITFTNKSLGVKNEYKSDEYFEKITPALLSAIQQNDPNGEGAYAVGLYYYQMVRFNPFSQSDLNKAIRCFQRAQRLGHIGAMHLLGHCHLEGIGVPQDPEKAVALFKKASWMESKEVEDKSNPAALNSLAYCETFGLGGLAKNSQRAYETFERAAEKNYVPAQLNLAQAYKVGGSRWNPLDKSKVDKHQIKAGLYFIPAKSVETRDLSLTESNFWSEFLNPALDIHRRQRLTGNLMDSRTWEVARYDTDLQVKLGNVAKACNLTDIAIYWYLLAAKQNHPIALIQLGDIDMEKADTYSHAGARTYYEKAVRMDSALALEKLATCYRTGKGFKGVKNEEEALRLEKQIISYAQLKQAAKAGDDAIISLFIKQNRYHFPTLDKALCCVAMHGRVAFVKELLTIDGIDVNTKGYKSFCPLSYASVHNHTDTVGVLLAHENIDIMLTDSEGCNAIMHATNQGHAAIVTLLLAKMTLQELQHKDELGHDVLQIAKIGRYSKIVSLITQRMSEFSEETLRLVATQPAIPAPPVRFFFPTPPASPLEVENKEANEDREPGEERVEMLTQEPLTTTSAFREPLWEHPTPSAPPLEKEDEEPEGASSQASTHNDEGKETPEGFPDRDILPEEKNSELEQQLVHQSLLIRELDGENGTSEGFLDRDVLSEEKNSELEQQLRHQSLLIKELQEDNARLRNVIEIFQKMAFETILKAQQFSQGIPVARPVYSVSNLSFFAITTPPQIQIIEVPKQEM